MLRTLLFCTVLFALAACGRENDITPTLAGEVAGNYKTNGFLDYLCIALSTDQMPVVSISHESASTVSILYQQAYPTSRTIALKGVSLKRLADNSIELSQQGDALGTVRTDRAFNNNGLERQALVLRVQRQQGDDSFSFTGAK